MKKIVVAAAAVLLILTGIALLFLRQTSFGYSGVIEAVEVDVSARLDDIIAKLNIDEGSLVKKGDVLAELECKSARLQYDIAEKEYERAQNLLKNSAGSQENYDLKKYRYDSAALAKSWCAVASPLEGRVLYKYYEQGDFIASGRKLATVADLSFVNAWVYVEHDFLSEISPGRKIKGCLPQAGKCYDGVILTINDEAEFTPKNVQTRKERSRLVFGVKTRFENDDARTLKPGMTVEVSF
ncbi:MAG: HlyD family efflux transporter periplasmic adaptor subunit [Elusimicrobiota bacterium]|jgi:HlyD family secretion protein|nr:HlyD family efflux transporter periplasmic adaptor subunit [Elusimicrobiota bacterium]